MKAIQVSQVGEAGVLKVGNVFIDKPHVGQALIRIEMSGVNYIDIYQRQGIYPIQLPYIPGLEGAGVVEEIGEKVTNVKVGDRVAFVHEPGAYAEKIIVTADHLIPLTTDLSFEQGAALPLQGMAAHYLLHEFREVKANDIVLVHAAAGGVGLLLVQWAKQLGARVIGTVSTDEKALAALDAGADDIIIYTKKDFVEEVKKRTDRYGADIIFDGVGKTTFEGNLQAAALRGTIVIYGAASGPAAPICPNVLMQRSLTVSGGSLFNFLLSKTELLERANAVIKGIKQGWLHLKIDEVFPLERAADAQRKLENRQTSGKVLLKIRS